jgi:hypothetical protein
VSTGVPEGDHASNGSGDVVTVRRPIWGATAEEEVVLRFEHGGWTADGRVTVPGAVHRDLHWVARLSPDFEPRQFLLFRDLDEPDLWLGTDGRGRWGEVNGAHRPELDGCVAAIVQGSAFLDDLRDRWEEAGDVLVAVVDAETLEVVPTLVRG